MKTNWLDKTLFSNIYNGDEKCNVIIKKSFYMINNCIQVKILLFLMYK